MQVFHKPKNPILQFTRDLTAHFQHKQVHTIDDLIQFLGSFIVPSQVNNGFIADLRQNRVHLVLLFLGQFRVVKHKVVHCFEGTSEFAKMFQGFFPAAERTAYGKNQGEDDGNAQEGQVHIITKFQPKSEEYGQNRNDQNNECPVVYYGKVKSDTLKFSTLKSLTIQQDSENT